MKNCWLFICFICLLSACSSGGGGGNKPTLTSFSANPTTISAGQPSTLSWQVSDATSLSINQGVGDVTGQTSVSVSPTTTTTYTLTASNADGSTTDQTTVTVSGGSAAGYLWYSASSEINSFTQAQVQSSSSNAPAIRINPNLGYTLDDVVFDRDGNLWAVGVPGKNKIVRFAVSSLSSSGVVAPDLTITSSELKNPWGIAFDSAGNLWVTNAIGAGGNFTTIVRFDNPQSLSGNQTLSPSVVIGPTSDNASKDLFYLVHAIAFDADGNLWVSGPDTILRFDNPQSLTGNITPTPNAVIDADGYSDLGFDMIAFDSDGALWVTGCQGIIPCVDFVMKFGDPSALSGVSSPTPATRITVGNTVSVSGLAFDSDGGLWVAQAGGGIQKIINYTDPGSLSGNVTPTPAITLSTTYVAKSSKLVFYPTPLGLPIY